MNAKLAARIIPFTWETVNGTFRPSLMQRALSFHEGSPVEAWMRRTQGVSYVPFALALALLSAQAAAQPKPAAPPAVGVVRVERQQITRSDEFIGRVQAVNRVAVRGARLAACALR